MQAIPNTGGGISGFLAHLLWQAYAYFPSAGRYDWVLLMLLLALFVHALYLPSVWRDVAANMARLRDARLRPLPPYIWSILFAHLNLFVLLWFFHTPAGKTFLEGRIAGPAGPALCVSRALYFVCLAIAVGSVAGLIQLQRTLGPAPAQGPSTYVCSDRSLRSLLRGGGAFVVMLDGRLVTFWAGEVIMTAFPASVVAYSLFLYWYWSVASLTLMLCFLFGQAAMEFCRMSFVYIHHKRTFG